MPKPKYWLINGQGLEWWHLLIIVGVLAGVFLIPFRQEVLSIYDVTWTFLDKQGNVVDPTTVDANGGFGITTNPTRLQIANYVGTTMLIQTPYGPAAGTGPGQAYAVMLQFPKSKVRLIHQSSCPPSPDNDGVGVVTDDAQFTLYMEGKEVITKKIIVDPRTSPDCDWVWVSGFKQVSIGQWLYNTYIKPKQVLIPAQPFAVITIGQ